MQTNFSFYEPQFAIGEKFEYSNKHLNVSFQSNVGLNYFFETSDKVVLEIAGFFPGQEEHAFKINVSHQGEFQLSKWFFELDLEQALNCGFIRRVP